jgi:sortase A
MPSRKSPQDFSMEELRWLLVQKRRNARQDRLERYRRTGRVVMVASDIENPDLDRWHSGVLEDQLESPGSR